MKRNILIIFFIVLLLFIMSSYVMPKPWDCCLIYAHDCQCMNGCVDGCNCEVPCEEGGICVGPSGQVCCLCDI